ncbi:MAG TPA: tetratricopeptide repeat protein [Gemmatimonadales bacterium]|nr:tetratricopeptide repeat protein [Gemmatimonadales bacterium]
MTSHHAFTRTAFAALVVALASAGWSAAAAQDGRAALDPITSAVINHPITTSSAAARTHFLMGVREQDLGRFIDANAHFQAAVAADPNFAFGYLNVANTANSITEFKTNLARAEQHAAGASDAEQIQIQMARKGFDNDIAGQLALAQQFVAKYPASPRAWLALAGAQAGLNKNTEARASLTKALELAPRFYVAHATLGNNYIFGEPRDFAKALEQMQAGVALAPNEPNAHMFVGDAYRAQRNLEKARDEYSRGLALDPRNGILLVKLGHANTFLGSYAAARANYDSAEAVAPPAQRGGFAPFHAYVSIYAGDPATAIDELNRLVGAVDGMGVTDPTASKVNALTNVVVIAIHSGLRAAAEQALKQLEPLLMQQADQAGNAAFRRGQEAQIAYLQGWLAAKSGDYAAAREHADRINALLAPDANPRKLEPMHQLMGFIALYQQQYSQAAEHFRQGNPFDPYVKYQLAVATEGAGDAAEARKLFRAVADYNFNALGFALVRRDAQQKAGAGT